MKKILLLLPLLVAACGESAKDIPLEGKRINVLGTNVGLEPDATANISRMQLNVPTKNANWPQQMANAQHMPAHLAMPEKVQRAWSRRVGTVRGHVLNAPVIHAGRLFVLDSNNRVTAISVQSGKELWSEKLPVDKDEKGDFAGGLAVVGDRLFATTPSGQVFALSASAGEVVWQTDLAAPLRAGPTIVGVRLFVISHDNRLFVLDVRQGSLLWTHSGMAETLALAAGATPAVAGETVLVPYTSGDLYALSVTDGTYQWHSALSRLSLSPLRQGVQGIAASPVVSGDTIIAATVNGNVAALNLANGQRLWKANIASSQTPWVSGNIVFALSDDGQLAAMNLADGGVRWVSDLGSYLPEDLRDERLYWSGPVLAGGRLIVTASNGFAMSIDPANGRKLLATQLLKGSSISVAPIVAEESLFFLTDDGEIVCFR